MCIGVSVIFVVNLLLIILLKHSGICVPRINKISSYVIGVFIFSVLSVFVGKYLSNVYKLCKSKSHNLVIPL